MTFLTNPTSIHSITALREELDYGDPKLSRCQIFYDSVRLFRRTFVSSQGWDSSSIHDWRNHNHQIALGEMVRSYLEQQGNGKLFWPDDASSSRANRYKYSTDKEHIKKTMRHLFWRLNIQQHRNIKYKKNKASGVGRKRGRSPSPELGIDTDVANVASTSHDAVDTPDTPRSSTFINLIDSPVSDHMDVTIPDHLRPAQSHPTNEREISPDPFRTESPEPHVPPPLNQPTFAVMDTGIDSDGHQVAPVANMEPEPSPKRAKRDDKASTTRMSAKKAGKQPAGIHTSRVSPRKRKLRNVTGRATDEQVWAAIQSPERNSSPEVVEQHPAPAEETNNVVLSDILPLRAQRPVNPYRATVSDVTDEELSVTGFVDAETGLDPTEPSNSTNHVQPSAEVTMTEAVPQPSSEVKPAPRQSSPIPLISPSVPPEAREAADERPSETEDAPRAPPAVGQAQVEFLYRVVCRSPELQSFSWKPEGSFRSKTLSRLEEELPLHLEWSQFRHLHFRLMAPNARAEHLVCRGREDQFDSLKRHLAGIIQDCILNTPCGKTILVEIDIEPLADLNSVRKSREMEVMDFDW